MQIANVERNAVRTEGDQMEKMLSPSEEHSSPVLNDTSAPLDFSTLTPCQFGISVQSFAPASLPNLKGERTDPYFMLISFCIFIDFRKQKCCLCID